jgi:hypothetical protein
LIYSSLNEINEVLEDVKMKKVRAVNEKEQEEIKEFLQRNFARIITTLIMLIIMQC